MGRFDSRRADRGFTLMETLVTVLIIICLLAVSMVAVVTYRDYLKIAELDNAAREIYMAAQNRAVLLDGRGSLEKLVVKKDGSNELEDVEVPVGDGEAVSMTFYYISSTDDSIRSLLPDGTIEPALWNGQFYVVYEPESASVTDVFYAEKPFAEGSFAQFYANYRGASNRVRMKLSPMTGYYGGDSAQGGSTIALRTPVIRIYNEDTLKAEVTWWVPRSLQAELNKIDLKVTLGYQDAEIPLDEATLGGQYGTRVSDGMPENGTLYLTYTRTYVLDSLEPGLQFKDLPGFPDGTAFGGNFELSAEVSYTGETQKVNGAKKTAENNSLFAYDEENGDDTVAYIEYLRHLQNLRAEHSGVQGKTQAVQTADIDASYGGSYCFLPVKNAELVSYKVNQKSLSANERFEIRNLQVDTTEQCAGLFGDLGAQVLPEGTDAFTVDGVRLVNASVRTTAQDGCAGALAGYANRAVFRDCRVYWEIDEEGRQNLQYLLGNNVSGYRYQVQGTYAGGLAGSLTESGIVDSFAATLVLGTQADGGLAGQADTIAGGLVGRADKLALERSYADCYLSGKNTAGLAGELSGGENRITDCYSAGFLNGTEKEGGFCLGQGKVTVRGSYSAMLYSTRGDKDYQNHYPLCEAADRTYENTCYLFSSYVNEGWDTDRAVTHQKLSGADGSAVASLFGDGSLFARMTVSESHPYNLQTEMSLSRYPYPALPEMGHYGDWAAEFSEGSLVYWEQYAPEQKGGEGAYRFQGANLNLLRSEAPVGDGYAIVLKSKENQEQQAVTIRYTYETADGAKELEVFYSLDGSASPDGGLAAKLQEVKEGSDTYYLAPLPEELVCSSYAAGDFYQRLGFKIQGEEGVEGTYWYNPHFAATMLEYDEKVSAAVLAKNLTVRVRTPRHLYELSRHAEYYASRLGLVFQQELDLDYDGYTEYRDAQGFGLYRTENGAVQGAIGKNAGSPFVCIYNGGCHVIANVSVEESGSYVGLFGYSRGVIRNTVYLSTSGSGQIIKKNVTGHRTIYLGGLVGNNSGTVSNCAVADLGFQIYAYDYSTVCAGGLVGINYGTVTGSSAALKYIAAETTYSNAYLGGFAGRNAAGGTIRDSYAVGRVAAARSRWGKVLAAGFAGGNQSTIRNNYAATALTVSGEATAYGFCSDNTGSSNFYLNGGTYRYDGKEYALQYGDGGSAAKAEPRTYTPMTDGTAAEVLGFASGAPKYGADTEYPYPAVVRDANGAVIHYGQWPEMLTLGTVGVCYWEKEVTQVGQSKNEAYHFSAIVAVPGLDGKPATVGRISTLCTEHNDGGVIKEYGYGYLYDGEKPKLDTKYTQYAADAYWDAEVSAALEKQTEGRYHFVAFRTRQEDNKNDTGLYLRDGVRYDEWTLSHDNKEDDSQFTFYVTPFFGDALAYDKENSSVTVASDVPTIVAGRTESVPYEVRSVRQLTFINWNWKKLNTKTVLVYNRYTGEDTRSQFPYLSYYMNGWHRVPEFWKQTHDLDGDHDTYSPIAEFYDVEGGDGNKPAYLWGWFGGTYDGSDYTIANMNIQGHISSCTGLFGAVYNGTLKDIIMYSTDGSSVITCVGTDADGNASKSCWYAMGALAGLAASDTGSAVVNCSVAGYTILDQHYTKGGAWGGSGIGGLLGISNMQLSGCSAVTTVEINAIDNDNMRIGGLVGTCQQSISDSYAGGEIVFRKAENAKGAFIGGIVGGIYMRRLTVGDSSVEIGGNGIPPNKPLTNALYNCYSYVVLPKPDGNKIKSLYAIGGEGDVHPTFNVSDKGVTTYSNCYYLKDTVLSENGGVVPNILLTDMQGKKETEVKALSYEEMSDGTLLAKLNSANKRFSTVTVKTEDGNKIDGRYSFATAQALNGLNYPFPTILTQANASYASGRVNVHYGDWPLNGIERENGSLPINIDLFADYEETKEDVSGDASETGEAQAEEKVWLSNLVLSAGAGKFTVSCVNVMEEEDSTEGGAGGTAGEGGNAPGTGEETGTGGSGTEEDIGTELPVAEVFFRTADGKLEPEYTTKDAFEEPTLVVRGLREGTALVTVSYVSNSAVPITPLTITVNVTAELQLKPGKETRQDGDIVTEDGSPSTETLITMLPETVVFANERSDINLYSFDTNGASLPDSLKDQITLNVTGVSSVEDAYLSQASAANVYEEDGVTPLACRGLLSVASRSLVGSTSLIVEYEYTYKDRTYQSSSTVNVAVKELLATAAPVELYLDEDSGSTLTYDGKGFAFWIAGAQEKGIEPEVETIYNGNTFIAYAEKNKNGTLQVTAGDMPGTTTITLTLRFAYEGSSHAVTVYLDATVYESRMTVTSGEMNNGTVNLYAGSNDHVMADFAAQFNERGKTADFMWELSDELAQYVEITKTMTQAPQVSELSAQSAGVQGPEPDVPDAGEQELSVLDAGESELNVLDAGEQELGVPDTEAPEVRLEKVENARSKSADILPEEALIPGMEEVSLPEEKAEAAGAETGNPAEILTAGSMLEDTLSGEIDEVMEVWADAGLSGSPQPAAERDGICSRGIMELKLTSEAEKLTEPISGMLTVTAVVKAADGGTEKTLTRTIEVWIWPGRNQESQTAFLAAEDVDGVLYAQKLEDEKEKEARRKTLAEGETIEPYTELLVQNTLLRAVEVTIPLGGVVPKDGVTEVESFWLSVLPRRAVSTVEDQKKKHPELTDDQVKQLQNLILPEAEWGEADDWEKGWSNYQVTGYALREHDFEPDNGSGEKYVTLVFNWSVYHEAGERTVTYTTELLPGDLIRVKPEADSQESQELESAGIDENGVAVYELDLEEDTEDEGTEAEPGDGTETEPGDRIETEPGSGTGTEPNGGIGTEPTGGTGTEPNGGTGTEPTGGTGTEPNGGTGTEPTGGTGTEPTGGTGTEPTGGTGTEPDSGIGTEPNGGTGTEPNDGTGTEPNGGTGTEPNSGTEPDSGMGLGNGTGTEPDNGAGAEATGGSGAGTGDAVIEVLPDITISDGMEGAQPGTEHFGEIGVDIESPGEGGGLTVPENQLPGQTYPDGPELPVEDAEIIEF